MIKLTQIAPVTSYRSTDKAVIKCCLNIIFQFRKPRSKHTSLNVVNYVVAVFAGGIAGAKLDIKRINECIILRTNPGHFSCLANCSNITRNSQNNILKEIKLFCYSTMNSSGRDQTEKKSVADPG